MRYNEGNYNRLHAREVYDWGQEWLKPDKRSEITFTDIDPYYSIDSEDETQMNMR